MNKMIGIITAGDHHKNIRIIKSKGLQEGKKTIKIIGIDTVGTTTWEQSILLIRKPLHVKNIATEMISIQILMLCDNN